MFIQRYIPLLLLLFAFSSSAQTSICPDNMGFNNGNFNHWECFTGNRGNSGTGTFINSGPVAGRHTLFANNSSSLDKFGKFPIHSPGITGYSVKLGNENDGAESERITYTFSIPAGQTNYSIVYQYAMVAAYEAVETALEKPSFVVTVFDVTDNQYISCLTRSLYPSPEFPGMKKSSEGINIYYLPWTAASLDLSGYQGKILRLEFTTADCYYIIPQDGHFGYAYIDVTDNCGALITGNQYCDVSSLILQAPPGYLDYKWFSGDLKDQKGTGKTLRIVPAPAVNTKYALKLIPFPGFGCDDTLFTTIQYGLPVTDFKLKDTLYICSNSSGDLTSPGVTNGSGTGLTFNYYTDASGTVPVDDPRHIRKEGIYYVTASNSSGCTLIKPIQVVFYPADLVINDPPIAYRPFAVNLTDPSITRGSSPGFIFTYWNDLNASVPLTSPAGLVKSGTFFIKAVKGDCIKVLPVKVIIRSAVPDTFTPNGDGFNDVFHVAGPEDKVSFKIYNRWGQQVFSSSHSGNSWDGNTNGKKQPAGIYYWILDSADLKTGKKFLLKGPVTLIR